MATKLAGLMAAGRTAVITQADAGPAEEHPRVLDAAERDSDQVLLAAEADDDGPWREFCLRQADRTLLLAEGRPLRCGTRGRERGPLATCCWRAARPTGALADWIDAAGRPLAGG